MLGIQFIRENPEAVRHALARRNTEAPLDEALALDAEWRRALTEVEALRAERNALSKEIGGLSRLAKTADTKEAKHAEHRRSDLVARSSFIGERRDAPQGPLRDVEAARRQLLLQTPNLPKDAVPDGADESANVVVRQSGEPPAL